MLEIWSLKYNQANVNVILRMNARYITFMKTHLKTISEAAGFYSIVKDVHFSPHVFLFIDLLFYI